MENRWGRASPPSVRHPKRGRQDQRRRFSSLSQRPSPSCDSARRGREALRAFLKSAKTRAAAFDHQGLVTRPDSDTTASSLPYPPCAEIR